jgi:acyl-CoA synthetase (AMP-forming)/AMP-acid ligase II
VATVSASAVDDTTTVPALVRAMATAYGDADALLDATGRLTYAGLEDRSRQLARQLVGTGVTKYARVGIHAPNSIDWAVAWFAAARIGAVAVPLSTFASGPELVRVLRHADCQAIVARPAARRPHPLDVLSAEVGALGENDPAGWHVAELPHLRFAIGLGDSTHPAARPPAALDDAAARVPDEVLEAIESEVHPADPATMIYTSGSTSAPKGVVHSHQSVMTQTHWLAADMSFCATTRNYTTMPFFWVGGLGMSLLPTLRAGGLHAMTEGLDPAEILELVERERLDRVFVYPPKNLATVVGHPDYRERDLSSVVRGTPGIPREYADVNGISYTRDGLQMGLGMSETFGPYWWGRPEAPDDLRTPPLERLSPGWELKVITEDGRVAEDGERGEIRVRGPHLAIALQKVDRAAVFDPDGFYRTGDIGLVDGDVVRFRGRANDMIKANGANVAAAEVVDAIQRYAGVEAAFVIGLPHRTLGAEVGAAVVARPDAALDVGELMAHLRHELASYKVPAVLELVDADAVPMTPTGKVDNRALIALLTRLRELHARPSPTTNGMVRT